MEDAISIVKSLMQKEAYADLKWTATFSADWANAQFKAEVPFQNLSEEGKRRAVESGYSAGDTIRIVIAAERDRPAGYRIHPKNQPAQSVGPAQKVACNSCGAMILPTTAEQTGGICKACAKKAQSKGMCFVATAAFGSPLANEILILQKFRDDFLKAHAPGRMFIRFYESAGPVMANLVRRPGILQNVARVVISFLCTTIHWWNRRAKKDESV